MAGRGGWVHVARTEGLTHYGYDARRGRAATDRIGILPGFEGTCVRDGWQAYDEYRRCRHALCGAHLLRELVYVEEVSPDQRQWVEPFIKLLLEIKAAAERARGAGRGELGEEMQAKFIRRYERLVRRGERLNPPPVKERSDPGSPKFKVVKVKRPSPVRPLLTRLRERREQVLRFMTDLSVPFDNNGSERDLRMVKLQQKVGGCFRTPEGAAAFCRIRGYLSTARKQGSGVLDALGRAFRGKPVSFSSLPRPE